MCWAWCSPFFPRSGLVAGEVAELFRRFFFSFFAPLAGRGGEGRSWWRLEFRFWFWCCRRSPSALLPRPALVARGVKSGGGLLLGLDLSPVQGSWFEGEGSGAGGPIFRRLLQDQEVGASRPMGVHRFMSRRLTTGDSRFSKAWRCSSFQIWGRAAFFFFAGVGAGREWRQAWWWFSSQLLCLCFGSGRVCEPVYGLVLVCVLVSSL